MITITATTEAHLGELSRTMRDADVVELKALGVTPYDALFNGWHVTRVCYTALDSAGCVVAVFGVTNTQVEGVSAPWLLASDLIEQHWVTFLRLSRVYIPLFMVGSLVLTNITDKRNTKILRWLKWCGFSFMEEPELVGENNIPFIQFYLRSTDV